MSSYPQLMFSLTCRSTQYPPTTVVWSKDGVELNTTTADTWQCMQLITNREETHYTNMITLNSSTTTGYAGKYTCTLMSGPTGGLNSSNITLNGICNQVVHVCIA